MSHKTNYEIVNAEAFEWLKGHKRNSVHAVITDPPFGLIEYEADQLQKRHSGVGGIWRLPQSYDGQKRSPMPRFTVLDAEDRKKIGLFHKKLARLLLRILVPGGHVIMASQNLLSYLTVCAFDQAGFEVRGQIAREVCTLRGGDRPKGAHEDFPELSVSPRSCWEPWLIFRKPCEGRVQDNLRTWKTGALRRPNKDVPFKDLITSSPVRGLEKSLANHPSVKPQAFMRQIVWAALPLGEGVILDPFMGSGSTIAAATHYDMMSIGIELDETYFKMAEQAIPEIAKLSIRQLSKSVPKRTDIEVLQEELEAVNQAVLDD